MFNTHRSLIPDPNEFRVDDNHQPSAGTMYVWHNGEKEVYRFPNLTMAREQERAYRMRGAEVMVVS